MINDELRWKIENSQRVKCFLASMTTTFSCVVWYMLLNPKDNVSKEGIIVISSIATIFTLMALALIFCNLGKETFKLEAKDDPTKG